jgi:hypothetical protein
MSEARYEEEQFENSDHKKKRYLISRFLLSSFFIALLIIAFFTAFFSLQVLFEHPWGTSNIWWRILIFTATLLCSLTLPLFVVLWLRKKLLATKISGAWRRTTLYIVALSVQSLFIYLIAVLGVTAFSDVSLFAQKTLQSEFGYIPVISESLDWTHDTLSTYQTPQKDSFFTADVDLKQIALPDTQSAPELFDSIDIADDSVDPIHTNSSDEERNIAASAENIVDDFFNNQNINAQNEHNLQNTTQSKIEFLNSEQDFAVRIRSLRADGLTQDNTVSLAEFRFDGEPTLLRLAPNGNALVVLGAKRVLFISAQSQSPQNLAALNVGQEIESTGSIIDVLDAVIFNSGHVLAVVQIAHQTQKPRQALVWVHSDQPRQLHLIRQTGMSIPNQKNAESEGYTLSALSQNGRVLVLESYRNLLNREQGTRLLSGISNNFDHFIELVRTGDSFEQNARFRNFREMHIADDGRVEFKAEMSNGQVEDFQLSRSGILTRKDPSADE